jgi:hypothetical protein
LNKEIKCRHYSLKYKVYKFNSHTLQELENSIREEITKIFDADLQRENQNVFTTTTPVY